ncbi:Cobalt-precorrin-4 C11-methyltransferase [Furfurilactobacillus rossiae]|uniref:cobalt-precorrin-4 methyltransferase n=1 Tax=Furfurilactobacillus rossiae TaxID=231049 RepID=UPI0015B85F3E|nr:cobalt-precorrin-4 methyltransferase [Furfurilactobacillus rossiae]MCF6165854.1 cobalt-precorrin-4 methyltransferase [Furfurilactobacillus rossiae]QLE64419.1 Cobalt-precorrin-4 C11-methyltransferase [Furfurilactobacillus rossiae]
MAIVSFVGAGPGDKDLITLKGYRRLAAADVVIYAGSLVNLDLLDYCKDSAEKFDSASMTLQDIIDAMAAAVNDNKSVVRLQTGDFSIYGSIREQIEELKKLNIEYECIPGVSSFLGAASSLGVEYTVPEVAQSVIITRMAGRTPVPDKESLKSLAQHQTSMVIFLSVQGIQKVVKELREGGYPETTPATVIYKATWPDEKHVTGTLADIAEKVHQAGIRRTALIMVGEFLGDQYNYSHLYDANFSHMYRKKQTTDDKH